VNLTQKKSNELPFNHHHGMISIEKEIFDLSVLSIQHKGMQMAKLKWINKCENFPNRDKESVAVICQTVIYSQLSSSSHT